MIDKPIVENLGCMKGPQPLHFLSAGGGVYVVEEKNSGAELAPAEEFFIPLKFSGREPLGEQENLQSVKSDPSLFTEIGPVGPGRGGLQRLPLPISVCA